MAPLLLDDQTGAPTRQTVSTRPVPESRADVEAALEACQARRPRLPLVDEGKARELLGDAGSSAPPQWVRLLANFPVHGKARILSQRQPRRRATSRRCSRRR